MAPPSKNFRAARFAVGLTLLALAGLFVSPARGDGDKEDAAAADSKVMKTMFDGPLNVYLSIAEVQNGKPSMTNVQFQSVAAVNGTRFYCFTDDKGKWYVHAASVYAIRVMGAK